MYFFAVFFYVNNGDILHFIFTHSLIHYFTHYDVEIVTSSHSVSPSPELVTLIRMDRTK